METNSIIEKVLEENRGVLQNDHDKYRNHVYRVYLLCLKMDQKPENVDKYAIAAVFHDIGIWTAHTLDYLAPSIDKAVEYLGKIDRLDWKEEISLMIDEHHKMGRYAGPYQETVQTIRQADWIDVSMGVRNFGLPRRELSELQEKYPTLGFHRFLMKQTFKRFLKHPSDPLPMFKK